MGVIPNHPEPAVKSWCFPGFLRKDDEKEVGMRPPRPEFFGLAVEEGVFTLLLAAVESSFLVRIVIEDATPSNT